jgi:hypothetical protein
VWLRVKSLRDCSSTAEGLFFDGGLGVVLRLTHVRRIRDCSSTYCV